MNIRIFTLFILFSVSFSFMNMGPHFNPFNEAEYDQDALDQYQGQIIRKKIYLPERDKIYRDENGKFFYMEVARKRPRRQPRSGGSGGFSIKSLALNDDQKEVINQQILQVSSLITTNAKPQDQIILFGGGGYWHASKYVYFGGQGTGGQMVIGKGSDRVKFSIGYGGIDFMVFVPIGDGNLTFFIGSLLGAGGLELESQAMNKYQQAFWIAAPSFGTQINFTRHFAMRLKAAYLYSEPIDSSTEGSLANVDFELLALRNYNYSITFEWGFF